LHYAKGEITDGQQIIIESILGAASTFSGRVVGHAQVGPYRAVVPEVGGRAFVTGRHAFVIDPGDELGRGFFLSCTFVHVSAGRRYLNTKIHIVRSVLA